MAYFEASDEDIEAFQRDGYLIVERLLSADEAGRALDESRYGGKLSGSAINLDDANGRVSKLTLWTEPGDDVCGRVSRSERIVTNVERMLGTEVYHFHSKIMLKEPRVGGAWEWHQDYGYWYTSGCLFPDMVSCLIALDPATKENGCLQVLRGSHRMGRIDHGVSGEQKGADPKRVEEAMDRMDLVYCEMAPGSAVFFHCNTLHASDANLSEKPRWSLICCYNAVHNIPYSQPKDSWQPLTKLPDALVAG